MRALFGHVGKSCSRWISNVVLVAMIALGLPVAAVTIANAAEPSIAFLNPSSFADPSGAPGIVVSDGRQNSGGEGEACCRSEEGYRLSAWTSGLPSGYSVFFVASQAGARGVNEMEIVADNGGVGDTWEAWWDIPITFLDGPATISAYAIVNDDVVASVSQAVTLDHLNDTDGRNETLRLTYPAGPGDPFGTYQPLAYDTPEEGAASKQLPIGVVDHHYTVSQDSTFTTVFYSLTPPGQTPEWIECGSNFAQAALDFAAEGTQCTLSDPTHQDEITAIAGVIEDSRKQSGDATSVVPYVQNLQTLSFTGNAIVKMEKNQAGIYNCTPSITLKVTDQVGRKVTAVNIDFRAQGPADNLKFGHNAALGGYAPPDRIKSQTEEAYDCFGNNGSAPGEQGEIPKLGGADIKILESSSSGTNEAGNKSFQLHSDSAGVTRWVAWVDEIDNGCHVNDDRFTQGELSVHGEVHWSFSANPEAGFVPETIVPCATPGPTPSGSPSGEPSPDPSGSPSPDPTEPPSPEKRTITSSASNEQPRRGTKIALVGDINSKTNMCETDKPVKIKVRRPGGRFHLLLSTRTSSSARYGVEVLVKGDRDYRAVAVRTEGCRKARSPVVEVRPKR